MNLQGTFLGMLGTVSAVTALNRQADITAAKEEASFKQQQAEKQFNITEDVIKKEATDVAISLKAGVDPEEQKAILKKKEYSSELIDDIMKQADYERYKPTEGEGEKGKVGQSLTTGTASPELARKIRFAQETYARQEELHNTLTKLKKGYGGIR